MAKFLISSYFQEARQENKPDSEIHPDLTKGQLSGYSLLTREWWKQQQRKTSDTGDVHNRADSPRVTQAGISGRPNAWGWISAGMGPSFASVDTTRILNIWWNPRSEGKAQISQDTSSAELSPQPIRPSSQRKFWIEHKIPSPQNTLEATKNSSQMAQKEVK